MKQTSLHTKAVWDSGDFAGGDRRPAARVTIQKMVAPRVQYRLDETVSRQWAHSGGFLAMMFGQAEQRPRELFNVRSVKWSRGVDSDVGTCQVVLGNVEVRSDVDPVSDSELDLPGYYTPNRGTESYFDDWGYVANEWKNWLVPDRLIRTYEGYGIDRSAAPERDPHMYPSGVWLVDDVTIATDGTITLDCRDVGRVLLDQVIFPQAVPFGVYPLWFDAYSKRDKRQTAIAADNDTWLHPTYDRDSNLPYIGSGVKDGSRPVVASDGTAFGHHGRDAFDYGTYSFWFSVGFQSRQQSDAITYLQGKFATPKAIEGVKIDTWGGPYRVYISLQTTDGKWLGNKRVPYKARDVDTQANIPYVAAYSLDKGETASFKLPKRYTNIKKIRYSFDTRGTTTGYRRLYHTGINAVYYASDVHTESQPGSWKYGNYGDYTEVVKWLLAWAGFYWPGGESGIASRTLSDGTSVYTAPQTNDPAIPDGRVWGDFEQTGTKGIAKLDVDVFDKKPFMEGIAAVREIVGFDFWIDETGGVIWRLPNIWSKGCYVMPVKDGIHFGGPRVSRTTNLVEIDERKHLIDQQVKLSSRNVRERIYVGNNANHIGAVVTGFRPENTGLRRIAGWTDQKFATNDECERMADLIALKQSFLYRQNNLTITANPALQPDDQVIITERMTGEGYIHRILNISSDFDNETGRWTYTLTTNWLGTKAFTRLAWSARKLTNVTRAYLFHMGKIGSPN